MSQIRPINMIRVFAASAMITAGAAGCQHVNRNSQIDQTQQEYRIAEKQYKNDSTKYYRACDRYTKTQTSYDLAKAQYDEELHNKGAVMLGTIRKLNYAELKVKIAEKFLPRIEKLKNNYEASKSNLEDAKFNAELSDRYKAIYEANQGIF